MSNNLLKLLKEHLSGDVVSNLASFLGESPNNTQSALNTALPSLLAGLVEKSADSKGLGVLFNLLVDGKHDGGVLSNLGALSRGGEETSKLLTEGGNLSTSILGEKANGIVDLITSSSGLSKTSTSSLLGFITPIVLGMIGRDLKVENIENPTGLAGLLSDQSEFLKDFIPAGLNALTDTDIVIETSPDTTANADNTMSDFDKAINSLDADDRPSTISEKAAAMTQTLGNIDDALENAVDESLASAKHIAEEFRESATQFGSQIADEGKEFAQSAANAFEEGTGEGNKFLPWLLILAALALTWGLLKSCSITSDKTPETAAPSTASPELTTPPDVTPHPAEPAVTAPPVKPAPPAPSEPEPAKIEAPNADKISDFFEKTLSTGYAIKAVKDGFESKLVSFIESSDAINNELWFTMDGITFDSNKATIKTESTDQIDHVAEILKAYPKVKIKIGGYTDNTGKDNANKKLSDNRANAVRTSLLSKGVKADRIDAEGYGSEHPVASNDSVEGRQKNRRIDVRVTEK